MIKPYTAVGLIPTVRGIRKRGDIKINLEHLSHLVKAASWLSSLDIPVRLIAFPEGALQAFNDEVLDLDHVTFARECAIDIPGEETEALGKIAKEYNAFVMAQAKARHPDLKDRYFNVGIHHQPARPGDPEALQRSRRCFRWSTRSVPTTSTTGGSRSTARRSTRSGRSSTPRSGVWAS
jgi:hypothetical protein